VAQTLALPGHNPELITRREDILALFPEELRASTHEPTAPVFIDDNQIVINEDVTMNFRESKKIAMIASDFKWSDVGSWLSFSTLIKPDKNGNRSVGKNLIINSKNTFIQGNSRVVVVVGTNNLIIIDTPDALLVIDKFQTQDVKLVTSKLKKTQQEVLHSHKTIQRPWGSFTTIETGPSFKIKRIEVNPLKSLSLQSHKYRSEHWVVIEGEAEVINAEKIFRIKKNQSTEKASGN
jgi:mannose-1-phosphate guanylyltransferase